MHPNAQRTAQQVVEACPFEAPGRFLFLQDASRWAWVDAETDGVQVTLAESVRREMDWGLNASRA